MLFVGTYEHTIDSKNRLSIPAEIRMELDRYRDGTRFFVTPGRHKGTLSLYTERRFLELVAGIPADLIPDRDQYIYDSIFFSMAKPVEMDKQGRILLPEYLLQRTGIHGEVVLTGCRDHLDIWNKADYEAFFKQHWERYPEIQDKAAEALRRRRAEQQLEITSNGSALQDPPKLT